MQYIVKYCIDRIMLTTNVCMYPWYCDFYSFHKSWCPKMLMKSDYMNIVKSNKDLSILNFHVELTPIFPNIASIWISDTLSGVPFRTTCRAISALRDFATSAALVKKKYIIQLSATHTYKQYTDIHVEQFKQHFG